MLYWLQAREIAPPPVERRWGDLKHSIIQNSLSHNCRLRGLPDEENARCSLWKIPN
nr:MAG TPA: hypothetical protein [Caudoviricetes sp.]